MVSVFSCGRYLEAALVSLGIDIAASQPSQPLSLHPIYTSQSSHNHTMASHNIALELGSAIQSASIQHHPDPQRDLNPSTAASGKLPVTLSPNDDDIDDSDLADDEIPISVLRPVPRRQNMPPLPDMRFEQSYLKSIEAADWWGAVGWITFRDQVRLS